MTLNRTADWMTLLLFLYAGYNSEQYRMLVTASSTKDDAQCDKQVKRETASLAEGCPEVIVVVVLWTVIPRGLVRTPKDGAVFFSETSATIFVTAQARRQESTFFSSP